MKVTFYSCFLTHHQVPFCIEMQKILGDDFKFVSNSKIFQWRLDLGFKDLDKEYDFVIRSYESNEEWEKAKKLADESDIVIIGSTSDELIEDRLKKDKITFRYRSRIWLFTDGFWKTIFNKEKIKLLYQRHLKYKKNRNLYLLCASGYGAKDFGSLGLYKNKMFKWGYFLQTNKYDIDKLIEQKENNKKILILWAGRYIKWKHPELVIKLAKRLKKKDYDFEIKMLGQGILEEKIRKQIQKYNLEDYVKVVGQVPSDKVKDYMEEANIFISTSDHNEGWGAVINESMNSGCTVIADERIGAAPFLIKNNETGITYKTYMELEEAVKIAINDKDLRKRLGKNAYEFITEKWTAGVGAENLVRLFESILDGNKIEIKEGPASMATGVK